MDEDDALSAGGVPQEQAPTDRITCVRCNIPIEWIDCPTGGWWAHDTHPSDNHDAAPTEDSQR